jgi:hypothetical protein
MKCKQAALIASFLMVLSGALAPRLTRAQENVVKTKTMKPAKVKLDTFKGEVIRMNTVSIIVRDPKDSYIVRTFTFSPDLTKKLQSLIERGGYQPGDTVTVRYEDGTSVADFIKGKPSKAY